MEEVWKDINLASLNEQNARPITTRSTFGGVIVQDFLGRPFSIDPPNSMVSSSSSSPSSERASLYCSASPTPPPPVTALSLNSRPEFHFDPLRPQNSQPMNLHHPPSMVSSFSNNTSSFESLSNPSSLHCFGTTRFAEPADTSLGDRRHKRMIKNRESAARSRARKQENIAYTNELQLKVKHLLEENARLKRQQQLSEPAASNQQKKKSNLYRASTAPF
ncbi:protein FD [Gastrolobium bilobum]|uniref:protein FD n=1 Tax=Gastrolobium bilobum TaxID=150636 RepID=UPI002AB0525D|nr:protein FD [Gastrolobium bilobum]